MKIELKFEETELTLEKRGDSYIRMQIGRGKSVEETVEIFLNDTQRKELINSLKILG